MATTIDATAVIVSSKSVDSKSKSWWSSFTETISETYDATAKVVSEGAAATTKFVGETYDEYAKPTVDKAVDATGEFVMKTALPGIGYGLEWTSDHVDQAAGVVIDHTDKFLTTHKNIAILCSPTTFFRTKAYQAVEAKNANASVATTVVNQ